MNRVLLIRRPSRCRPLLSNVLVGALPVLSVLSVLSALGVPQAAAGQEIHRDGDRSLSVSLWGQSCYQFEEEGGRGGR